MLSTLDFYYSTASKSPDWRSGADSLLRTHILQERKGFRLKRRKFSPGL